MQALLLKLRAPTNWGNTLNRRDFFRRLGGREAPLRPPWALAEESFPASCTSCGDCLSACPQDIIVADTEGRAKIDFARGSCTFCGACAEICSSGAFLEDRDGTTPWSVKAEITSACLESSGVACRTCESACNPAALRFRPLLGGRVQVEVRAELCTGCGACREVCPVAAIKMSSWGSQSLSKAKQQEDAA